MSESGSREGLPPQNIEALKGELYEARYSLVAKAHDRILEAAMLDLEDSNYYHVLDTDDEEMPVFLRDQTTAPEMYKAVVLSDHEVGYLGDEAEKLLVMLPQEFLINNSFDGLPESHQHIIVHRYQKGNRISAVKAGVEGLRFHYWEDYEQEYEEELDKADKGIGSKLLSNVIQLFNTEGKPLTAYEKMDELDRELMMVEKEKLRALQGELEEYVVWPQRRKKISQRDLFSD